MKWVTGSLLSIKRTGGDKSCPASAMSGGSTSDASECSAVVERTETSGVVCALLCTKFMDVVSGLVKVGFRFGVELTANGTDETGFNSGAIFTGDSDRCRSSSDSSSKPK
jgi:Glu-tRNA(Gln) amidotransferase subunit E-like FAD-binding protein